MPEWLYELSKGEIEIVRRIVRAASERLALLAGQVGKRLGLPELEWIQIDEDLTRLAAQELIKEQQKAFEEFIKKNGWRLL